jgi:hypothetical protein
MKHPMVSDLELAGILDLPLHSVHRLAQVARLPFSMNAATGWFVYDRDVAAYRSAVASYREAL